MTDTTRITDDWINDPNAQAVCAMLTRAGHHTHFVGGCVRNALMGVPVTDLDIATSARPEGVMALAKNSGFNPVPTGIEYGTVTVVVKGEPFEITTWRRDVETDGRRAVVAFADTMEEDAHRRDFTMNALYATPDGEIVDPLGGLPDLRARRVRFIDDPKDRIREDFLRILRFFRFHAWYGDEDAGLDQDALAAIADLATGIETLSRERVGAEMLKLLSAPDPAPALAAMDHAGVLGHVMPGLSVDALPILVHFETEFGAPPNPLRRLACLGGENHGKALRLSKVDERDLDRLLAYRGDMTSAATLGYRLGSEQAMDVILINASLFQSPPDAEIRAEISRGATASFPVKPQDLMPELQGAGLGAELRRLEDAWIASDFSLDRDALLDLS